MTREEIFSESFWDADITSQRGYDIIVRRMKEGRKVCKELEEYLKERNKAEIAYARALKAISKKLEGKEELGNLGASIRELKLQTDRIASAHDVACTNFQSLSAELQTFKDEQDKHKSVREDILKKQQQNKLQHYQKTVILKDKYIQRCRDRDNAKVAYDSAKKSVTITTKELTKIQKNDEKSVEQREQADILYKGSVDILEQARKSWEAEMENCCKEFQNMEEHRIYFTRDLLWKVTNIDSQTCVTTDECCECVRKSLELCDVDTDIQTFVDNNKLGKIRPGAIAYECYYKVSSDGSRSNGNRKQQPLPPETRPIASRLPVVPPTPSRPAQPPPPLISFDDSDAAYASIDTNVIQRGQNREARIVRQHEAKDGMSSEKL